MLRPILFTSITLLGGHALCQENGKELDEVLISQAKKSSITTIQLDQSKIESKLAPDIGTILMMLPGLQIKNYGDVGGLKTAGFRSLGAAHSSIVIDFQNQPVTQTGSVDLSSTPTEFVRSVQIIRQDATNVELPIQSKLSGSLIQIKTLHSVLNDQTKFIIGLQNGSFGYNSLDLGTSFRLKKNVYFTFTGRGRIYEGNFPFQYRNGFSTIEETRQNNALTDLISTASLTWKINENNTISVKGNYFNSDKELAGAVVFYNANNKQYLTNRELTGTLYHHYHKNRISLFTEFTTQQSQLTYLDSNYLNAQGYLEQTYTTRYLNGQSQFAYQFTEKLKVSVGSEYTSEEILSGTISGSPHRTVLNQFIASEFRTKRQKLDLQTGFQYVDNQSLLSRRKNWNYLPALQYLFTFSKNIEAGFIARYTVRQPTFSELYYQRIGNTDLKPEEATILSLPVKLNTKIRKWNNSFRVEPFYTYNTNKILAIPTKNLFVWSIQNIGKSQSTGIELYDESRIRIGEGFFGQTASFTYQSAIDLSDPKSSVYRNQLTYIPFTSGSLDLNWSVKNWSIYSLFMFQGYRYALQENIPSNIVDGYYTIDIGGSVKFDFKNQHLKLNVSLKNITNQYNQYIRYFVLPGFNYQLKLTYAI